MLESTLAYPLDDHQIEEGREEGPARKRVMI